MESNTTKVIDPWGGSYFVERLTHDLAARALTHVKEVEALGGMAAAIEQGLPKMRIEEAAARTQARIDSGRQTVVGVNKFKLNNEDAVDVLKVDNSAVRTAQIDRLKALRDSRNEAETQAALAALSEAAQSGAGNLLALAVDAARAKGDSRRNLRCAGKNLQSPRSQAAIDFRYLPKRFRRAKPGHGQSARHDCPLH